MEFFIKFQQHSLMDLELFILNANIICNYQKNDKFLKS